MLYLTLKNNQPVKMSHVPVQSLVDFDTEVVFHSEEVFRTTKRENITIAELPFIDI